MAIGLPSGEYLHSTDIQTTLTEKKGDLVASLHICGNNVLGVLTIKAANSLLGYKGHKQDLCHGSIAWEWKTMSTTNLKY